MGQGRGQGAETACVKLFRDSEEAGGGHVCAQNSAPAEGYSLLTQTQVLICMLFMSSQTEQEHLIPSPNRTTQIFRVLPLWG